MNFVLSRLFQPSTYAGAAALAQSGFQLAQQTPGPLGIAAGVCTGIFGLFAMLMNEGGSTPASGTNTTPQA